MPARFGLALVVLLLAVSTSGSVSFAQARIDCSPNCDFNHDYSPADLGWLRPGLTCYPVCDVFGRCAPTPACLVVTGIAGTSAYETGWLYGQRPGRSGRITVRARRVPAR